MSVIADYRCTTCDTVSEHWISAEELATLSCPDCGNSTLRRIIGATHIGYTSMATDGRGTSDGFTTAIDRWAKMREQKVRIEKRNLERHGTEE